MNRDVLSSSVDFCSNFPVDSNEHNFLNDHFVCSNSLERQVGNMQFPIEEDIIYQDVSPCLKENAFTSLGDIHANYDSSISREETGYDQNYFLST